MPPRISRSSAQSSTPRASKPVARKPKKARKRALDAFSIASHQYPERAKVRQNRLGESDLSSHRKRPRDQDEDAGSEDEDEPKRRKQKSAIESDDEGSDSEGNTWTMGHVNEDDDSDIDSDEAFGESDEEKFEGWTFRGGSTTQKPGKKTAKAKKIEENSDADMNGEVDLDERDGDGGEEEDVDDLGEDAIDLATALDQYEESEEEAEKPRKRKKKSVAFGDSDSEPSEGEDIGADGNFDFSSSEDEEDDETDKLAKLKDLITSLPEEEERQSKGTRRAELHESAAPSEFGVMRKVDIAAFKRKVMDPERKKALKLLQDDPKPSKRNDIARKLDAPLPKRQQDKLHRQAANTKTNETLERWVDTIKQNRRAEHLSFPLMNPNAGERMNEKRLMPTTTAAPANDLEATIQSILQQSGLSNGKDDEEQIQKWEELQTNKLPLEEVAKRRAQLRTERELLFREEVRAKRIKKIKSKSYRRVHRKERERGLQREREALKADGIDVSEDEREYNDRRRAEERMGQRHRESKWAKGAKARAAWDEDARAGVTEMARANEELRRRIEGKEVRKEDDEDRSDFSSDEDGGDDDDDDPNQVLQKQLGRVKGNPFSTDDSTKLGSMAFMRKAEAARKARNDEDIERLRRELAGEDSDQSHSEEDENQTQYGRRKYMPGANKLATPALLTRSEFEERHPSDDEEGPGAVGSAQAKSVVDTVPDKPSNGTTSTNRHKNAPLSNGSAVAQNSYLAKAAKKSSIAPDALWKAQDTILPLHKTKSKDKKSKLASEDSSPEPRISAPDTDGWQTVTYKNVTNGDDDDNDNIENEGIDLDAVIRKNQALTSLAFAGDNVEAEFAAEKAEDVEDQDEKDISVHLPGWGSGWVGEGVKKSKGKKVKTQKQHGVKPNKRRDAKLDKVIISEKKVKKSQKLLASSLPFPFETKEQYERSLRLPKGPEFTTKQTFQDATKPRIIVKQGIIRPMSKPMV